MSTISIPKTFGALLIGALFASFLSGVTTVQSVVYYKLYPNDATFTKVLVLVIWAIDIVHTGLVWDGLWYYLIRNFGERDKINQIPLTISLTIIFTAILTLLVHSYYVQRIFRLSRRNYWLCAPIVIFAVCRLCSACATSAEMIRLRTFSEFRAQYRWLFSLGLAFSSIVDVIITVSLFVLLWMSRAQSLSLDDVLDSLILYTLEIGSLTGFATIVAMICWLAVKNNLIFLGLHFVIGKLYANSLMASLNTRHQLRRAHARSGSSSGPRRRVSRLPISVQQKDEQISNQSSNRSSNIPLQHVQINIEKSVQYDDEPSSIIVKTVDGAS